MQIIMHHAKGTKLLVVKIWLRVLLGILLTPAANRMLAEELQGSSSSQIDSFFDRLEIPELRLQIDRSQQDQLRDTPRQYARCTLIENGQEKYRSVGVKLKGAAGSYRDFDDRPGLTLNMDKSIKGQRFHGMEKFHLNNAVQDETWLNEWFGNEIFRAMGIPAPRVGHVRLWINERDMGLYVLREGFDRPFFERVFGNQDGDLYDGGFAQDIDSPLEKDFGTDPDDRQQLIDLAIACFETIPEKRWKSIEQKMDIDQFLTFMAVERILGHWDGYTESANNYRLYFPASGQGLFLPHGMDQILGDPWSGLYAENHVLLSSAVMQCDRWRTSYRDRLMELVDRLGPADAWIDKLEEQRVKIQKVLQEIDPGLAESHTERVKEFEYRWIQRMRSLPELIEQGMPQPLTFEEGTTSVDLVEWFPAQESDAAKLELIDKDDRSMFCIECERSKISSLRGGVRRYCGEASIDSKADISMKGSFRYPMIAGRELEFEFIEDLR